MLLMNGNLYIGKSWNLLRRVPESQNERRIWGAVYFLPMSKMHHAFSLEERKILLNQVEASCISVAHTMILGHQLPLLLGNRQHAKTLPLSAWASQHLVWPPSQRHDVSLGINAMTTIFKDVGVAARHCKLPSRKMLASVRGMEFSEKWSAYEHVIANLFQPNFAVPRPGCFEVKKFKVPSIAVNDILHGSINQAA
ncbi:hypothetical protein [Thioclava sp. GXIMD4216]|uniref:hypothetical protein n=1 Tax=Thioclava sp. GXIMD4216 TaxID=3131929 RepID=UPI0030CB5D94